MQNDEEEGPELIEGPGYVDINLGPAQFQMLDGRFVLEEDFKVSGEIWRVHLNDADPFPSQPHAHCVGGKERFIGLTVHLGSGELYDGRKALCRRGTKSDPGCGGESDPPGWVESLVQICG